MKNPFTIKNFRNSPVTTFAGLLLLIAGIVSVLYLGIPWMEGILPIALGIMLIHSPDTVVSYLKSFLNSKKLEEKEKE